MGHRNIQFTGHMIESEADQQAHHRIHPEPCVFYGSIPSHPQLTNHTIVPAPGSQCNFSLHPMPGHTDGTLLYTVPQYTSLQPHHPPASLDLAVAAAPSGHYNPYTVPQPEGYFRNVRYMDDLRLFKRKNAEGPSSNHLYQNASAGPSFSTAVVPEQDLTRMDSASFLPPEYGGNDPASVSESGSRRSARNMAVSFRPESALAHNSGNMIQGNYIAAPAQFPGNPWLNMPFGATNGDIGTFLWTQPPTLPYIHAGINGACVEVGNAGVQCYQATTINRTTVGFAHSPVPRGHSSPPHPTPPMQPFRANYIHYPPQVASSSRRTSTINPSNNGASPFLEVIDTGPTFLAPAAPAGFRVYQPQQREIILDPNPRQRNHPHLRVLPEDEVAILEFHEYHDTEDSIDQHRDMRLDIDHMSYEELLALGEHIGSVNTGLTNEFIQKNLKTKNFTSPPACVNVEQATCSEQGKINFCVVCQTDYECDDTIGILDCGHEYHRECIAKWLVVKNACPVCKSTALNGGKAKDL